MEISKQAFASLVKNAFEKNDIEITKAFVETCNMFNDEKLYNNLSKSDIYNITTCGEYGLQGFVEKAKNLVLYDLGCIYEDYKANTERNTYFIVTPNGVPCRLVNCLDEFIDALYDDESARNEFLIASKRYAIMDSSNGHNQKLVDAINEMWIVGTKRFWAQILYAIAYRDEEECKDKGIIVNSPEDALENANLILEQVCADEELELILNYLVYLE